MIQRVTDLAVETEVWVRCHDVPAGRYDTLRDVRSVAGRIMLFVAVSAFWGLILYIAASTLA